MANETSTAADDLIQVCVCVVFSGDRGDGAGGSNAGLQHNSERSGQREG